MYIQAKIVDRSEKCGLSVEKDHVGELFIKSPGAAVGKIKGQWPEIEPLKLDEEGYINTGDLVEVH